MMPIRTILLVVTIHIASKNILTCLIAQQLMSVQTVLIVKAYSAPYVTLGLLHIALILPVPTTEAHVNNVRFVRELNVK